MTIAGSDSGGGAGIQADLKTFAALGCYGTSAVTAVTAQNTMMVLAVAEVPEEVVILQIDGVLEDIGADAVKTGMLSSESIVVNVADRIEAWGVRNLVVDPVMVAKSGDALLQPTAVRAVVEKLLPLAEVVTPNLPEAAVLARREVCDESGAREAAKAIFDLGPSVVVVKGGHLPGRPVDLVYDGSGFVELEAERVETANTHGTGCTFSAAITAYLAHGLPTLEAIAAAKAYLTGALRASYQVGDDRGHSPVNHFWAVSVPAVAAPGRAS